jgi:hypothetical protein
MHHPDSKGNAQEQAAMVCAVQYTPHATGDAGTAARRDRPQPIA